ncbi:hypothetical protein BDW71DRAFT_194071 [Aspergillus fruticulosus]
MTSPQTPTILIIGATGNISEAVTSALPSLRDASSTLAKHQILGLTRSLDTPIAQQLASLPSNHVVRAFIASHNDPTQFAHELTFLTAALEAGVQYVVRISTTAGNIRPDCAAYYGRTHWAIEQLLGLTEFKGLAWISPQPDGTLWLVANKDAPGSPARLLALNDECLALHNGKEYVPNGPQDITGQQIVDMVEDISVPKCESMNVILSTKRALETAWDRLCMALTTSEEVLRRPRGLLLRC